MKIRLCLLLPTAALLFFSACTKDDPDSTPPTGGGGSSHLNPNRAYGSVTDQNGNTYATIVIGTQEWMAENLRTATYANGDPIPNVTDMTAWMQLTTGAWAHYSNDSQYESPYGKLYNWYAVADLRNVCPTGWHVPTEEEWTVLSVYLGGTSVAGSKMKSTGMQYWNFLNTDATNESGFSGLPGGIHYLSFDGLSLLGNWWSASESGADDAWCRYLVYIDTVLGSDDADMTGGLSVRCIKD